MTPTPPTAAETYAALNALRAGLDDQIAAAKAACLLEAAQLRKASWSTPYGAVNMTRSEERVVIDDAAFLAMVQEHYPDDVVTTYSVRSSLRDAFARELTIVRGEVVHKGTGEVVPWAHVAPEGNPQIAYPATMEQKDAKAYARMLFEENAERLTGALREIAGPATTEETA